MCLPSSVPGLVFLGPNTNGSQFFLTFQSTPHLNGKHVVFGRVVEGLDVLKLIEQCRTNTRDDRPVQEVAIVDCGEIKSAPEAEGAPAEVAAQKKHRVIDDDETDVQHELPSGAAAASAAAGAASTAFPMSRGNAHLDLIHSTLVAASAEEAALKKEFALAEAKAKAAGKELTVRERKLIELKLKRVAGSRANAQGVAAEAKKNEVAQAAGGADQEKKRQLSNAEFQSNKRQWESDQAKAGLDPSLAFLNDTAESAEYRDAKGRKKGEGKKASFGWAVFNQDAQYNAYEKRLNFLPSGQANEMEGVESNAASAVVPAAAAAAAAASSAAPSSLSYGGVSTASKAGVDRMVAELAEGQKRKEKFSRRRPFNEDEDVNYINERNRVFTKKLQRAYEPYTLEIKQNLERGTAL